MNPDTQNRCTGHSYAMRTEKDSAQTKKHLCQSGFTFHEKCGSGSDPGIFKSGKIIKLLMTKIYKKIFVKNKKIKFYVTKKFNILNRKNSALVNSTYQISIHTPQLSSISTKRFSVNPSIPCPLKLSNSLS
jgi:hypothetical protein